MRFSSLQGVYIRFFNNTILFDTTLITAHIQVSNVTGAIKVACDFISVENLPQTLKLVDELRDHRLAISGGDDLLQLHSTLWYAWLTLSDRYDTLSPSREHEAQPHDVEMQDASASIPEQLIHDTYKTVGILPGIYGAALNPRNAANHRRKKAKVKNALWGPRRYLPGNDFRCPMIRQGIQCQGTFNREGLINHLLVTAIVFNVDIL